MNAVTAFAWKPDSSIGVVDVLKRRRIMDGFHVEGEWMLNQPLYCRCSDAAPLFLAMGNRTSRRGMAGWFFMG